MLDRFTWHRTIVWIKTLHRWTWKDVRRWLTGPNGTWLPINADGIELINLARKPAVTRYRYRGDTIPSPWVKALNHQA
jgi:RNA-directed DNA polymerase